MVEIGPKKMEFLAHFEGFFMPMFFGYEIHMFHQYSICGFEIRNFQLFGIDSASIKLPLFEIFGPLLPKYRLILLNL